ncbi:26016_t:CDS:1, partial [Gigaspora rosea]
MIDESRYSHDSPIVIIPIMVTLIIESCEMECPRDGMSENIINGIMFSQSLPPQLKANPLRLVNGDCGCSHMYISPLSFS